MGGSSSKSAPAPPAPRPAPLAPRPASQPALPSPVNTLSVCAVKKVELNQLTRDVSTKQTEVDSCDPVEAQNRKTQTAILDNKAYVEQKRAELDQAVREFNTQRLLVGKLGDATESANIYANALGSEIETMNAKKRKLENAERASRRMFLDNDPQSGVDGFLGIRTSDDKIVLMFWICYILAISLVATILINMFGPQMDIKKKLSIGASAVGISFGIAYYCITKFG